MDLGIALGRFYKHVEEHVRAHAGRVVKFVSDSALAVFPSIGGVDHAGRALGMVQMLGEEAPRWWEENMQQGQPTMEYSLGLASGNVLHGEIGTEHQRSFDVLGRPVALAVKLARLATVRGTPHLVGEPCVDSAKESPPTIELEGAEFGGEQVRLFRVLTGEEARKLEDKQGKQE
jgi:adenylate cyclase